MNSRSTPVARAMQRVPDMTTPAKTGRAFSSGKLGWDQPVGVITISTRRFIARPCAVELVVIGALIPRPA
jgi:hypothetical protein